MADGASDSGVGRPDAVLFVDGVRRVEARAWIESGPPTGGRDTARPPDPEVVPSEAALGLCASYAAGVLCCCGLGSHLLTAQVRRRLVTFASDAVDISTAAGRFEAAPTNADPAANPLAVLSNALQWRVGELELIVSESARIGLAGHGVPDGSDLLVVDGPLRGRTHLPRALGFVKTHRSAYLPPELHAMVGRLAAGERTPVFLLGTRWDRYSWYLRLPCPPGQPWAGIVRVECSPSLSVPDAVGLARLSQAVLPRYASIEYKDPRAPQNLFPIGGLEAALRRRLGDPNLVYRALRAAARS